MLRINVICATYQQRKAIQKRFRLITKLRRAIAETMGTDAANYDTVHIDSQSMKIDVKEITCDIIVRVHHFSSSVHLKVSSTNIDAAAHSLPVSKLADGCENGILADVWCSFRFFFFLFLFSFLFVFLHNI